jgi:signal recognition particle receptor subunit beta
MAVFNYARREIDAKIVYYGPGICGKTTNLQYIHQHMKPDQRGKMVSLATDEDRTLFFDFLPIELQSVRGFKTRFHLYTVPGQVFYGATRRAVLTGADGVIFVVDSQADRLEDNLNSWKDLEDNLRYYGKKVETTPLIIQYNKRDLPNVLPVDELNQKINRLNVPFFESVAVLGKGVFETLTMSCRMVLQVIENGVDSSKRGTQAEKTSDSSTIRRPQTEKSAPASAPSPSRVLRPATVRTLRLAKEEAPAAGSVREPMQPAPSRMMRMEQTEPRPQPLPPRTARGPIESLKPGKEAEIPENVPPPQSLAPSLDGKREEPHVDMLDAKPPFQLAAEKPEEEKKKTIGESSFVQIEKTRPEIPPNGDQAPPNSHEKIRIVSCGEAKISSPDRLEIPVRIELNGMAKPVLFNINVAIHLEKIDGKID